MISDGSRPAAFLDRDGTLIVEYGFLGAPDRVALLPGAAEAVRQLNAWGYWVIGVSNQSGVARGYYEPEAVEAVNRRVVDEFARRGARIDHIYYCPHYADDTAPDPASACTCRKPAPGMIEQACREFPIDLAASFVVGDRVCDVALAQAVGIPGMLVLTGYGVEEQKLLPLSLVPAYVAADLRAAVEWWGRHAGRSTDGSLASPPGGPPPPPPDN
ncbi:MAG: HAD family hydrolase [Candidatus Zixiibacteriota bacterium]